MNEIEKWRWLQTNEQTDKQKKMKIEKWYQREWETVWWRERKMNEHIVISKMSFIFGFHDARHTQLTHTHTPKTTKWWWSDCLCSTSFSVVVASGPIFCSGPSHSISELCTKLSSNSLVGLMCQLGFLPFDLLLFLVFFPFVHAFCTAYEKYSEFYNACTICFVWFLIVLMAA